jgi:predicted secreted protein
MGIVSFIAVYTVIWSLVFQVVLPFGVTTQAETNDVVAGSDPGAPVRTHFKLKLVVTSLISLALWGVFYWLYRTNGIGIR